MKHRDMSTCQCPPSIENRHLEVCPHFHDPVKKPRHYTTHPSGVECLDVAEHMSYCLGNAIKYIWRAGKKGDAVEDLRKAVTYLEREIARLSKSDPA